LKAGHFCWFINGTICRGETHESWEDKIKICRKCNMFLFDKAARSERKPQRRLVRPDGK
jgi:hypothetical protein